MDLCTKNLFFSLSSYMIRRLEQLFIILLLSLMGVDYGAGDVTIVDTALFVKLSKDPILIFFLSNVRNVFGEI